MRVGAGVKLVEGLIRGLREGCSVVRSYVEWA